MSVLNCPTLIHVNSTWRPGGSVLELVFPPSQVTRLHTEATQPGKEPDVGVGTAQWQLNQGAEVLACGDASSDQGQANPDCWRS